MKDASKQLCNVEAFAIKVSTFDTVKSVSAFLHTPQNYPRVESEGLERTAAILISGAGGGVVGPSSIYLGIADKLASLSNGLPVMRLDFRYPARNKYCVPDVVAAMNHLKKGYEVNRIVLVGWSFGGAPVFTVAAQYDRVVGCATVASQTAETEGVQEVALKAIPVLLMHGTSDRTLSSSCSESLFDKYRRSNPKGQSEIKLFDGDDHALTKNSMKAEQMLCEFIMKQTGEAIGDKEQQDIVSKPLMSEGDKIERMKQGGDLDGESIE